MTVKGEVAPVACDALTWVGPTPWAGAHRSLGMPRVSRLCFLRFTFAQILPRRVRPVRSAGPIIGNDSSGADG